MWKVIIVEDEFFVRESVKELIRWGELGFELVAEAGNGEEALEMIKNEPPDLVITDIMMPRMDGVELLKETRKAGIDSKFVMLTCMGDFEYMRQAMEYGASNYILKLSMSVNDLRETLGKINKELMLSKKLPDKYHMHAAAVPDKKIPHPELNKIVKYIEQNYDKDISVKSLAKYVMMGENYVSALFKKKMGKTLIQYLHEVRVKQAIHYLTETDLTIHEIGLKTGFVNDNYFIKIFKRFTGTTPSQYRQNIK
ncbi:MAG: response regulator [Paenibacillus sp.]|jgi:YesN/AraC family two-component response regulator|nr:response regulator [Paenibacillus sp.]